ncbi:MAG: type II toxin-antitoxin system VapC family toxin [Deltaproteobacteria bacterium]|nr:type II toxin-antitoxin system VapC family toxin [Deltaproteobacteria bacterium]
MMIFRAIQINHYPFSANDEVFIDANVWLYVFCPRCVSGWKTRVYSEALAKILTAGSKVFVDVLVISEFMNRYSRMEFESLKNISGITEFKPFRNNSIYFDIAKVIANDVRRILSYCRVTSSGLEEMDMGLLEKRRPYFNDMVLAELCRVRGLKMITHDGDFKKYGITVLTANKTLLS